MSREMPRRPTRPADRCSSTSCGTASGTSDRCASARGSPRRSSRARSARNTAHIRRSFGTLSSRCSAPVVFFCVSRGRVAAAAAAPNSRPLRAELERAERLHEGFLEGAADRHHLADRLHLRGQRAIGARELLERPARDLDDDVVDGRLERRRRQPGDVVGNLVEVIAERELGGDLGDRETRSPSRPAPTSATRAGSSR